MILESINILLVRIIELSLLSIEVPFLLYEDLVDSIFEIFDLDPESLYLPFVVFFFLLVLKDELTDLLILLLQEFHDFLEFTLVYFLLIFEDFNPVFDIVLVNFLQLVLLLSQFMLIDEV